MAAAPARAVAAQFVSAREAAITEQDGRYGCGSSWVFTYF